MNLIASKKTDVFSFDNYDRQVRANKCLSYFFLLIFINFLIINYLFNGYQYLFNKLKVLFKKNVIEINGFAYAEVKNYSFGFVVNHNGINYYRLSNVLTLRNCWQLIVQFGFDVLITIFSILSLSLLAKGFIYHKMTLFFVDIMLVIRICSFLKKIFWNV